MATKAERYEEAAADWGKRCGNCIKEGRCRVATILAIKAATCAFIAHPEWREG